MKLTYDLVRRLFSYDPATGQLVWKYRPREMFIRYSLYRAWNATNKHQLAFTQYGNKGHRVGCIFCKEYYAHRIIFLYMTGNIPCRVYHKNGIPDDNRWANLTNEQPRNIRRSR